MKDCVVKIEKKILKIYGKTLMIMRTYDIFESRADVCDFLDELEEQGVLPATIHITEFNDKFTVFYKKKSTRTNL